MALFLVTVALIVVETALATYTATRAASHRPARLFALLTVILMILNLGSTVRIMADDPAVGRLAHIATTMCIAFASPAMLGLISALFMPQWWDGARPIRWIMLPYAAVTAAFALDLAGGFGWFTDGVAFQEGAFRLQAVQPGSRILVTLLSAGWLVHIALLTVAFARNRATRRPIAILLLAILVSGMVGLALRGAIVSMLARRGIEQLIGAVQTLPILAGLTYIVLRSKLIEPTTIALDLALQALDNGVAVIDPKGTVMYANSAVSGLGVRPDQSFGAALGAMGLAPDDIARLSAYQAGADSEPLTLPVAVGTPIRLLEVVLSPVTSRQRRRIGTLFLCRDITELERRNALLDIERTRLAETVEQLEQEQRERSELSQVVQALSLPVIPVLEGVLVLPLIGSFDERRSGEFTAVLTRSIVDRNVRQVLIDLTGVQVMDESGVAGLLQGVQAAALLGARCILVGIRPEIAQSLVALDIDPRAIGTAATLQSGIAEVLRANGRANQAQPAAG